ncbi:MAG: hypothetical protein CL424_15810 [Acidimicrobiaceae bacterium]|nr:hypothetical protein [Acidimicrobiaceae bacterium]
MKRELTLLSVAALVLAACGGDDESETSADTSPQTAIQIDGAWARESPDGVTVGAAYFDITAADDDVLIGATVSSDVAGDAQIHEVVPADEDESMDDMSDDESMDDTGDMSDGEMDMGAMVMQEMADGLPLPAGDAVSLEPGGYHVMLLDLVQPLASGDEFDLTLDFENADDVTLTVTVAETAPGS